MMLLKIAWRNIWRNPLRSSVIMLSMVVGLWAGVFINAFFQGMTNEQVSTAISRQYSHIQIHRTGFMMEEKLDAYIPDADKVAAAAGRLPAVQAVSGRMLVTAMAATAHGSAGVTIYGIDPAQEQAVTGIANYLSEGSYFGQDNIPVAVIGRKLKEKLGLQAGQKIIFTFTNQQEEMAAGAFRVAGVFTSNNSTLEEFTVYVQIHQLAPLAGLETHQQHELAVLLRSNDQLEATALQLQHQFPALRISTWKQLSPELRLMIDSFNLYMFIIIGIILLALVFGIVNTMLMAVLERQRELGVLMAVGMNRSKIFSMVLLETLLMTLAGCAMGLPLAALSVWWFGRQGIDLSNWSEGLAMYGYGTRVYPALAWHYYFVITLMALVFSLLAAIYPARRSLRLKPAEAIRKI